MSKGKSVQYEVPEQDETVAKYDRRKILLENLARLTAIMLESRAYCRWNLLIFICLPAHFVFRNSFKILDYKIFCIFSDCWNQFTAFLPVDVSKFEENRLGTFIFATVFIQPNG